MGSKSLVLAAMLNVKYRTIKMRVYVVIRVENRCGKRLEFNHSVRRLE